MIMFEKKKFLRQTYWFQKKLTKSIKKRFLMMNLILCVAAIALCIFLIVDFYFSLNEHIYQEIGKSIYDYMGYPFIYFIIIAVAVIILTALMIYMITTYNNSKKLIKQQERTNRMLDKAIEIANAENEAKSEFISYLSHDIRTPINAIMGMNNIAIENIDNKEKVLEALQKIQISSTHVLALINDILNMAKLEKGKEKIRTVSIDLEELITDCASMISGLAEEKNITFCQACNTFSNQHIFADEVHLRQILINILGNAVKFTPAGGRIDFRILEIAKTERTVTYQFEIEDTGIGMSEKYQQKIYEPFSREEHSVKEEYQGTGLGMTITKQLVDLMGGTIAVRSRLTKGTKFTLVFIFDIDKNYESKDCQQKEEKLNIKRQELNIIVAEDNPFNMEIVTYVLKNAGHHVMEADNGKTAVEFFEQSEPGSINAIYMDIVMPIMDGIEATKAIREMNRKDAESVPIIAMTACTFEGDIDRAKKAGINEYITKPLKISKILEVVDKKE